HFTHELGTIESVGGNAKFKLFVVEPVLFQSLAIRVEPIGVVAVVDIVGGEGDAAVPERDPMLDSFAACGTRIVVSEKELGMVEAVTQDDGRKAFVADFSGDVAIGECRAENGSSDPFANEELRVRFVGKLISSKMRDFQVEFAFE